MFGGAMAADTIPTISLDFTEHTLIVREIANGVMTMLALLLSFLFIRYVIFDPDEGRWRHRAAWKRSDVQGAVFFAVLIFGHAIRGVVQWLQYIWAHIGWDPTDMANNISLFVFAVTLIVVGKLGMVYVFAPKRWRRTWICVLTAVCIIVPIAVAVAIGDIPDP